MKFKTQAPFLIYLIFLAANCLLAVSPLLALQSALSFAGLVLIFFLPLPRQKYLPLFLALLLLVIGIAKTLTIRPLLPINHAISVLFNSLGESPLTGLFGVGLGNFRFAFFKFRPAGFNLESFWQKNFTSSNMFILDLLVEQGIVGTVLFLAMAYFLMKPFFSRQFFSSPYEFFYILFFIFYLFLPFNWFFLASAIMVWRLLQTQTVRKTILPALWGILSGILIVAWLLAYEQNNRFQKYIAQSREIFAKAASAKIKDKKELKNQIMKSLSLAKAAILTAPQEPKPYENLGLLASRLTNILENNDTIALANFAEALKRNPRDPRLYFEIGIVRESQNNLSEAAMAFEEATRLKKNFATAWLKLGLVQKELGQLALEQGELTNAKTLIARSEESLTKAKDLACVNPLSSDCQKVQEAKRN